MTRDDTFYRPGVGIVLFNREGRVLLAERLDHTGAWQLPQGGIDPGEAPEVAVFREMAEEIGTDNARILGMLDEWLYYDFPPHVAKRAWDGQWRGQRQKWIALEFMGADSEIRLDAHSHPEFGRWKWVAAADVVPSAVAFKRHTYETVMAEFARFSAQVSAR
jgi:putative (di)nucleoside polyphosphate hydrolase